ncbi:hypothetical protein [Streptomyces sp. FH025]|uniref:hypothetical protein n=1 Tax=Streptomyces sp. FH025 TaxID=2815937 RepID=UPI001A9F9F12|nr:hypothetical protein [Streptomyces sp. FH025]MBO1413101.1 hypothetical protein [Streptomyces sp. FH025]
MTVEDRADEYWEQLTRRNPPEALVAAVAGGERRLDVDGAVLVVQHLLQLREFDAADQVLAAAASDEDPAVRAAGQVGVAWRELIRGGPRRARAALRRAEACGDREVVEEARFARAMFLSLKGDREQSSALMRACLDSPRPRVAADASLELGFLLVRDRTRREQGLRLLEAAHASGYGYIEARAALELADQTMETAPVPLPAPERSRVVSLLEQARASGYPTVLAKAELLLGLTHWERREHEPARELWLASLRRELPDSSVRAGIQFARACVEDDGPGPLVAAQELAHALRAEPATAADKLVDVALGDRRPLQVAIALALTSAEKSPDRVLRRAAKRALRRF